MIHALEAALAGLYLCALGNRLWGSGKYAHGHLFGALFMATGAWVAQPFPVEAWPVFLACIYIFRTFADGAWLDYYDGKRGYDSAFNRACLLFPLVAAEFYFSHSLWTLGRGEAAIFLLPLCYRWTKKQSVADAFTLSELSAGVCVGLASA